MNRKIYYLDCQCESPFHTVRLEKDLEYNEYSITITVSHYMGFFNRLKACLKYLFFLKNLDFDSFLLKEEDKAKILEWIGRET